MNEWSQTGLLPDRVQRWRRGAGTRSWADAERRPNSRNGSWRHADPCRPGIEARAINAWERRHGYRLPESLRAWLALSNGFYREAPLVHPLTAIGPMVPFASVPELVVQPESWFELGNPNVETVCIDLAYQWPGGGNPIFTSGDDESGAVPG